jgi:predicted Fe-Mo cluster-binding NifX family protein
MKIAITSCGKDLGSEISADFSSADYFILIDTGYLGDFVPIKNHHKNQVNDAEIFGALLIISYDVKIVLTGYCSQNALRIFQKASIKVIGNAYGTVEDNILKLTGEDLNLINNN